MFETWCKFAAFVEIIHDERGDRCQSQLTVYFNAADHPCAKNNGGCTHLCLIKPSGYQCACPTVIKDKRPCSTSLITQPSSTIKPPTAAQCACPTVTKDKIPSSTSLVNQSSSTIKSPTAASDYCKRLHPCDNEGTCKTIGNDYKCDCVGYYGGKTCSVDFSKLYIFCASSFRVMAKTFIFLVYTTQEICIKTSPSKRKLRVNRWLIS